MLTESLKKLIIKKYYNKKEDIENKLNIFYAMNDEEYIELTMLVENTYTEPVENIEEATEVAEGEE